MAHTYGTVPGFKAYAVDKAEDFGNFADEHILKLLRSVSASEDAYCQRTGPGRTASGFGPRLGTNRYDGVPGRVLDLDDDLLAVTSVGVAQGLGSTATTYVDETDFYLGPYDATPYREATLNGLGQSSWYGVQRGIAWAGKWGYQDVRETIGTLAAAVLIGAGTIKLSNNDAEAGMTLYIGSEQLEVTAVDNVMLTVKRGANGTTPAAHDSGATVECFTYPEPVTDACYQAAMRRRRSRDAGLTGDYGGGPVPITTNRDTERAIFRELLWPYAIPRIG